MDKEAFEKHRPYAGAAKPSMLRRRVGHDYGSRCIYLITMTVEGRRPLLGTLVGSADAPADSSDAPHVVLTPLGERVRQAWQANSQHYQGVSVLATMVMPDHLHGILFFREKTSVTLGTVIKGFKAACNKAYRELLGAERPAQGGGIIPAQGGGIMPAQGAGIENEKQEAGIENQAQGGGIEERGGRLVSAGTACQQKAKRDREHGLLWSPNYNDHILEGAGELERWFEYLRDNPRRLAMRRTYREYFRVRFDITVGSRTYAAIGNRFLLDYPQKMEVQCSRSLTAVQIEEEVEKKVALARAGVVLVSPSISDGEKAVMDAVLAAKQPQIFLTPNGFNEYSRPGHRYYDACAEGRFLILAPWPHQNRETPLTRAMCLELNAMAKEIVAYKKGLF